MIQSNKSNATDPKLKTFFTLNETILFEEDEQVEYKNYKISLEVNSANHPKKKREEELNENLKRVICGFLNNKGGRLYIGITDDRVVVGVKLSLKQKDYTRNDLTNLTYDFYPKCRTDKIKVQFVPVKNNNGQYINHLYVIKVIVKKGEGNKLYSILSRGFKSYQRLPGQCVELTASEIEKEILDRSLRSIDSMFNLDEFNDPEPEVYFPTDQEVVYNDNVGLPNVIEKANKEFINMIENEDTRRDYMGASEMRSKSNVVVKSQNLNSLMPINNNYNLCEVKPINLKENKYKEVTNIDNNNNNNNNIYSYKESTYEDKKAKLELKKQIESNYEIEKPVVCRIYNFPLDVQKDEISQLLSEFQLDSSSDFEIFRINEYDLATVKVKVIDKYEANKIKENLNDSVFKNRKIEVKLLNQK